MTNEHPTDNRRDSRALVLLLAVLALITMGFAACGDDDDTDAETGSGDTTSDDTEGDDTEGTNEQGGSALLQDARENGITIGIANERPYGYEEGGEATGEAPELAKVVFERMGITEVEFEVSDFGALINGINAGRFDVIAAGMFINPERAEQVAFADPDYCATTGFAVPEGNPDGLSDFQSAIDSGVTIGVLRGAVEGGYAEGAGVPSDQIETFDTTPDLFDALTADRIDAVALTAITVREQVAELDGYEATDGFVPVVDGEEQLGCGAFAFAPDNADFRDEFNEVLHEMQEAGEVLPIIEEFGFTQAEVDAAVGVTVEDLAA